MADKMKSLYIFEGAGRICIVRGTELGGDKRKSFIIKHKGIFGRTLNINNLPFWLFGEEKLLHINGSDASGWRARRVLLDLSTHESYIPDINPEIIARIKSLEIENEALRKRIAEYEETLRTIDQAQLMDDKIKKMFTTVGEAKNKIYSGFDYGGGFMNRGLGGPPPEGGM